MYIKKSVEKHVYMALLKNLTNVRNVKKIVLPVKIKKIVTNAKTVIS